MKRQQVNISNVHSFCLSKKGEDDSTCARVDAILLRRKDSKSHLKVHRVENLVGPQTQLFDPASASFETNAVSNCPPGAEERLRNAEEYLGISKSSLDVFQRLKAIEDKILYLESISPEYFDVVSFNMLFLLSDVFKLFLLHSFQKQEKPMKASAPTKRTYSSTDLNLKVQELELKLLNKQTF